MPRNQLAAGAAMGFGVRALAIAQWCDRQGLASLAWPLRLARPRRTRRLRRLSGGRRTPRPAAIRSDPARSRRDPRRSGAIPERSRALEAFELRLAAARAALAPRARTPRRRRSPRRWTACSAPSASRRAARRRVSFWDSRRPRGRGARVPVRRSDPGVIPHSLMISRPRPPLFLEGRSGGWAARAARPLGARGGRRGGGDATSAFAPPARYARRPRSAFAAWTSPVASCSSGKLTDAWRPMARHLGKGFEVVARGFEGQRRRVVARHALRVDDARDGRGHARTAALEAWMRFPKRARAEHSR